MLSAWFRMKYPNIVAGAIAASAPIWQFTADCDAFSAVTTSAFQKANPQCPDIIRSSWDAINTLATSSEGLEQLTKIFRLCSPLKSGGSLKDWLSDIYGNIAMANYPYSTDFLSQLPAWPVKVMCANITNTFATSPTNDPVSILTAIFNGVGVYQNFTGDKKCYDVDSSSPFDINMDSWEYQTCTEFVFPMCNNGKQDMFEPADWDPKIYDAFCNFQFQTTPRAEWPSFYYGATPKDIKAHSNIVFSNGGFNLN
jgi:lysosomal Pro-X carboxypeptidase